MAVDLAHDYYGTHCLVPRSMHLHCLVPRSMHLLVQVHMAHLVFQIWQLADGLVISPVSGTSYLHYDTPLVHPGSFLTCDTFVFSWFLRSLFFNACLGSKSSYARSSLILYSFSLIQQFLSDLLTIVPLSAEGVAVAISSLSLRVDSFDNRRSIFQSSDSFWSNLHQFQVTFVFDKGRLQVSFCSLGGCFFWFCSMATFGVCSSPGSERVC